MATEVEYSGTGWWYLVEYGVGRSDTQVVAESLGDVAKMIRGWADKKMEWDYFRAKKIPRFNPAKKK